eukprot:CAMPEP_0172409190 /NCGR_PEP_ID=MMETSP1061-20121228/76240_1 /TAXON_ID=37318 /ORGANISM="Pseudo-nitzschia pungens, Strain cf. pungens" /LENGTH=333 /DNA_ID=CAMNT_0013145339 /DNA_START=512 /DNA_END=1513 /DNA_ORIENTATION=-
MTAIPSDSAGESTGESTGESSRRSCSRGSNSMSQSPRTCILGVGASAGRLCGVALNLAPDSVYTNTNSNSNTNANANTNSNSKSRPLSASNADQLTDALNDLMVNLCATASSLNLDWVRSIRAKMALNEKKYPVEHCKGKAGKYTKYSHLTGVTTTNQSTQDFVDWNDGNKNKNENENDNDNKNENRNSSSSSIHPSVVSLHDFAEDHLVELSEFIAVFATERLWAKYHTPRNLVLALLGEAGELAELLQWNGDHDHDHEHDHEQDLQQQQQQQQHTELDAELDAETLDKLSQELADVSIYAIRLATVCGVVEDLRESLKTPPGASNTNSTAL